MTTKPKDPAQNAAHQKAWRDRNRTEAGGPEVRGIFAPKEDHPAIKEKARDHADKLARKRAPKPAATEGK